MGVVCDCVRLRGGSHLAGPRDSTIIGVGDAERKIRDGGGARVRVCGVGWLCGGDAIQLASRVHSTISLAPIHAVAVRGAVAHAA